MGIPVSVIGGYLGAGKTTLVNHLLRNANGRKLAVLVNEFGELPIDADLIEADDGDMISIAGGCICCSYGSDLVGALMELPERMPNMDGMLIEASGVALPGGIVSALSLLPDYDRASVFVLADAETVRERGEDKYLADTVIRQLQEADFVALNKMDVVSGETLQATTAWIHEVAPQAEVLATEQSQLPSDLVLEWPAADMHKHADDAHHDHCHEDGHHHHRHHVEHDVYITWRAQALESVSPTQVAEQLADVRSGLLRAKGFMTDAAGEKVLLQVVGRRFEVTPTTADVGDGIVCIGPDAAIDHEFLATCLRPYSVDETTAEH